MERIMILSIVSSVKWQGIWELKYDVKYKNRVLKLEGELFIISHGQPKARKELFKGAVDINKYEFLYSEQRTCKRFLLILTYGIGLSDISQLINIFRSKLKDKPLSQILKDKELLKESLKECNHYYLWIVVLIEWSKLVDWEVNRWHKEYWE